MDVGGKASALIGSFRVGRCGTVTTPWTGGWKMRARSELRRSRRLSGQQMPTTPHGEFDGVDRPSVPCPDNGMNRLLPLSLCEAA